MSSEGCPSNASETEDDGIKVNSISLDALTDDTEDRNGLENHLNEVALQNAETVKLERQIEKLESKMIELKRESDVDDGVLVKWT